jgi:homogentisate 1,2-dioxygenase
MAESGPGTGGPPPNPHLWTRGGFLGDMCVVSRPHPVTAYTSARGEHAPHRLDLTAVTTEDQADPEALPTMVAHSRKGASLWVSRRSSPTSFAYRNAEYDELHFVQSGEIDYVTDYGTLRAEAGDFVCIPRAVTFRVVPATPETLRFIVESPTQLLLKPPAPFGMVNMARDVKRPNAAQGSDAAGPTRLLVRAFDGITEFELPEDPMALNTVLGGVIPVWKLNLAAIQPLTYVPHGGPPDSFAESADRDLLFYTLSARPGGRPPMHHNADYDELIFYFRGPGAYGAMDQPGLLAWTPKSLAHWGPVEDVEGGYLAWLLESTGTFRLTEAGRAVAQPMETGQFGLA